MELKLNKEEICSSEVILSTKQEQSIELDYVLPDYCPEIFKIVKCCAVPRITSSGVSGGKLSYELNVDIRVLYCAENRREIQLVNQKLSYSKSVELGREVQNPDIIIRPRIDYVNCRAVNQRRLDIRGAVSIDIKVKDCEKKELVSDAFGMGVQLHKIPVTYPSKQTTASAQHSISEELDLGASKPPVDSVILCGAEVTSTECKIIANKVIVKGELIANVLYNATDDNGAPTVETMEFALPFSKIIDMDGIDERFECRAEAEVSDCDIVAKADSDGKSRILECFVNLTVKCSAFHSQTVEIADDAFSTEFASENELAASEVELAPMSVCDSVTVKTSVSSPESLECVYGARGTVKDCGVTNDEKNGQLVISGTICFTLIGCGSGGMPVALDKDEQFSANIAVSGIKDNSVSNVRAIILSCTYNLSSETSADVKADVKVCGTVSNSENISGISDIKVDEETPAARDGNYSVKLYFADSGEPLWDIARRYKTSVEGIMDENNLEGELVANSGMIIIPIE